MSTDRARRALELLELAISLPQDQVARFLDDACGGDDALRSDVVSLLAATRESDEFLPGGQGSDLETPSELLSGASLQRGLLQRGDVLMERYTIHEAVGAGGMGRVYRATDSRLGRDVAIKVLSRANAGNPEMRERFDREMRSAAAFSHPNVMEIYDVGSHDDFQLAVMEYIEGRSLRKLIDDRLSIKESVEIATGIAAGLAAAHERELLHRDIKPENIMVSSDGHVKILDFGLARPQQPAADQSLTRTSMVPGTIPYMSPEQSAGEALQCSTDIFSMGTMLYEMLAGKNPFLGASSVETLRNVVAASPPPVSQQTTGIPTRLETLVAKMLRAEASERPSAKEAATELKTIRGSLDIEDSTATRTSSTLSPPPTTAESIPKTQYARCGDIHIAYQVFGDGPINLLLAPGFISNIDNYWASPQCASWLKRLGSFARVGMFDKRGTGLSDRVTDLPNMEERIEDVCAVMDAAGFETAAVLGISEGGSLACVFAATYPQRCDALILHGSFARFTSWFETPEALEQLFDYIRSAWGSGASLPAFAPSMAGDAEFQEWWGKFERLGANPGAAISVMRMNSQIDITRVLPSIQAPTLVINRTRDCLIDPDASRFLAENIPGAVRYKSDYVDHIPFVGDPVDGELQAIREFLQLLPDHDTRERVLATVLAIRTDASASDSTLHRVRDQVKSHRGAEVTSRHGVYVSTFEGPVRAIRCAKAIAASVSGARLCVHTGEITLSDDAIEGPAVDVAANVVAASQAGEVVVTRIVKDLVAGSGLQLIDLADREVDAEPGHLYRVR